MSSCMRNLLITLTLFFAALFFQTQSANRSSQDSIPDLEAARGLAPAGLTLEVISNPFLHVVGKNQQNAIRWRGIYSQFLNHQISGYNGPISLLVGLGENQEITGITVIQHQETPSFFQGILSPWFLKQFCGKTLRDPFIPFKDIDGLTRATVSVQAICDTVRCCLSGANGSTFSASGSGFPWFRQLSVICLFLAILSILLRTGIASPFSPIIVIITMGILTQQFLSLSTLKTLAYGIRNSQLVNTSLLLYLCSAFILIVIRPRGYCQGICPTGMLQEIFFWLSRKTLWSPPQNEEANLLKVFPKRASLLGRTLLWSALIASIIAPAFPLEKVEIFSALWNFDQSLPGLMLILAFLVGSLSMPRWYCRNLCPLNPAFSDLELLNNSIRHRPPECGVPPNE